MTDATAVDVQGHCDPRFTSVQDLLAASLADGGDLGASVAVTLDGDLVVDLWGGWADEARTVRWSEDTITNVWSTTKTMTNLCALILADRGELDLHAPVARYWPEFAANGKRGIEVRHILSHTAGLSGWEEPITVEDLYDWEKATSLLAAQAPWWEPGTASGYHAVTQGYLVGEVVRRVTGQTLRAFFAETLAKPFGADFHIGLPAEHDQRVSPVVPPPPLSEQEPSTDVARKTLGNPPLDARAAWTEPWRRAEIPAANGHGNARSVASIQAVLACEGEVGGRRLLSSAGCDAVFQEQARGTDLVLGVPMRLGVGYGLVSPEAPLSTHERVCFWGGWGGSVVVVDLEARMTVAYMMNKMADALIGDLRGISIVLAAGQAVTEQKEGDKGGEPA